MTPTCCFCDNPATCIGKYESQTVETFACDDCCGHGNEDGHCTMPADYKSCGPAQPNEDD